MTDLRAALIEVGARALAEEHMRGGGLAHTDAEVSLDAFLDVLADRADEWDRLASAGESTAEDLIAVLRGDT